MASLSSTKYANNIRTVSGLGVFVFPDDVTLNCNTSLGAVSIDLLEIPANFWSTTYKLYVNDANNNASVNNITINAPAGYTINNAASIVINTNGGGVLIRVTNNTTYMATANSTGGGAGGYNTIQDEGLALPQRTIMNFIGAGVTASDVGGKTQIDIIGGIIDITEAAISTLISSNAIRLGQHYRITDVTNADLGVVVQGVRVNGITAYGTGIFLNADYQATGDYSSAVPSFVGNIGIWSPVARPVVVGNVVVYNNLNFVNLTGVWGTAPNTDLANWSVLTKGVTTGYILACDFVKYDITANRVVYRADKLNNEVDYFADNKGNEAITYFQWGRNLVQWNKVLANGIMLCRNSSVTFTANNVNTGGIIDDDSGFGFNGVISTNTVTCFSQLQTANNSGDLSTNTLVGSSNLVVQSLSVGTEIKNNLISNNSTVSIESIFAIGLNKGKYYENTLQNNSIFTCVNTLTGSVFKTVLSNRGRLSIAAIAAATSISFCNVLDNMLVNLGNVTNSYSNFEYRIGYSNWEADLDFTTRFALGTLTIPTTLAYVGKFNTLNSLGSTITDIVNLPTNHPVTLIPDLGNDFTLQYTAVGLVAGNEIIRTFAAASDTFTAATFDRSEFVILKKFGGFNGVLEKYKWQ